MVNWRGLVPWRAWDPTVTAASVTFVTDTSPWLAVVVPTPCSPNASDLRISRVGVSAVPLTGTRSGLPVASWATTTVADFGPGVVGAKCTRNRQLAPG